MIVECLVPSSLKTDPSRRQADPHAGGFEFQRPAREDDLADPRRTQRAGIVSQTSWPRSLSKPQCA